MMRHLASGLALAFQFFSVIPVKKVLPMEKRDLTAMYAALPFLGALLGGAAAAAVFLLREYSSVSPLLGAFLLVLFFLAATGGLHMDGLADTADAYFSYQDRERRLEILEDPRIGAFGAMALIMAIAGKILILAELFPGLSLPWLLIVPVLARTGLLVLFVWTKSAKEKGLAAFFQQRVHGPLIAAASGVYLLAGGVLLLYAGGWLLAFSILAALLLSVYLYRRWCLHNFGGVTGDLFGAYVEGAEILLWTIFLLFI